MGWREQSSRGCCHLLRARMTRHVSVSRCRDCRPLLLGLQFVGGEFAPQPHVVINAQRLVDALAQCGDHALDSAHVPTGFT